MSENSTFGSDGFFSSDVEKEARLFRERNLRYFALYERIARLGYKTVQNLQNNSGDVKRGIVTCLVIRSLSCYDAIRLCVERGMEFEATVLLRSQLEAMYAVAACEKDAEFYKTLIKASTRDKHRILNRLLLRKEEVEVYSEQDLRETVVDLQEKINSGDIPKLLTKEIAVRGGMERSYELVYSYYSLAVHVNPVSLQEYMEWDDKKGIVGIAWGPEFKRAKSFMLSAMNTMIISLLAAGRILAVSLDNDLEEIFKQWQELCDEVKREN